MLPVAWLALAVPAAAEPLGEAWVRLDDADLGRLSSISGVAPAGDRQGAEVRVLLEPGGADRLRDAGFTVSRVREDHRMGAPPAGYHDPAAGSVLLHDLVDRSVRAGFVNFGASVEGRPIDGMWIGVAPGAGAPVLRILGGHHGDEVSAVEVALAVAERLVNGDGQEPAVTALLDRATVWIVPFVNPDGIVAGSRINATGVDLNRNYDFHWNSGTLRPGTHPFSEPETRAIRAFGTFERPLTSLSLHAGAANLGWPWNYTTAAPGDLEALTLLSRVYARECTAPGFWTTQGAAWYITYGDTNDWAYGRYGALDFTLEVSEVRAPTLSDLPTVIGWHTDAILAFLAVEPNLSGTVTDPDGVPIEATLSIDGSQFLSDPATGTFHRIAPLGAHTLHVEAAGYGPVDVEVDLDQAGTDVPVVLVPNTLAQTVVVPSVVWEAGSVRLERDGPLTLSRPDAEPVPSNAVDGTLSLDPASLAPGWWTIELQDGTVWPRALFVEAAEDVVVDGWAVEADEVRIDGAGFAEGARAWAVWGRERVPTAVPVVTVEEGALWLDVSALPTGERVDLGVWTAGGIVGLDDLWNPRTRGSYVDEDLIPVSGCACRSMTGHVPGAPLSELGWMITAALVAVRRRTT